MSGRSYRNGKRIEGDCLNERAFVYADGVFETMRAYAQRIPLWGMHRERLERAAKMLRLPIQFDEVERQLEHALKGEGHKHAVVKLIVGRSGSARGSYLPNENGANSYISVRQHAPLDPERHADIITTQTSLLDHSAFSGLKLLNRLPYIVAAANVKIPEAAELLFLNSSSKVLETMHHNIFLLKDACLYTPDLLDAGVEGVMRRCVIERLAPRMSFGVKTKALFLADFESADAVFLTNAVDGLVPVDTINGKPIASNNSVAALQRELARCYS